MTPGTSESVAVTASAPVPPGGTRDSGVILVPHLSRGGGAVPEPWREDVAEVLIAEDDIQRRVAVLAGFLAQDYAGKELLIVPLLTGTIMFMADLLRHLPIPLRLDFMGVSSYREGTSAGEAAITKELRLDARDRHLLIVDDILDTGRTLAAVRARLARLAPRSLRACVLLDKPSRRVAPVRADYVGFEIPDLFVVGYGLDYAERYRNLPFIGVLHPHLYGGRQG